MTNNIKNIDKLKDIVDWSLSVNRQNDFWSMMSGIDYKVANLLLDGQFNQSTAEGILAEIENAARLHPTEAQLDSVKKQFRFIAEISSDKENVLAAQYIHDQLGVDSRNYSNT